MKWKTREGDILELSKMTDSHLVNACKMLKRQLASKPGYMSYMGNSDHAADAVELENRQNEEVEDNLRGAIWNLEQEIDKRTN